jgi:hypothetical protein
MTKEFRSGINVILEAFQVDINNIDWKYYDIRETEKITHLGWAGYAIFIGFVLYVFVWPRILRYLAHPSGRKFQLYPGGYEQFEFVFGDNFYYVPTGYWELAEYEDVYLQYGSTRPYLSEVQKFEKSYQNLFMDRYGIYSRQSDYYVEFYNKHVKRRRRNYLKKKYDFKQEYTDFLEFQELLDNWEKNYKKKKHKKCT